MLFSQLATPYESQKIIDLLKTETFGLVSNRYTNVASELLIVPTLCVVLIGFNSAIYLIQKSSADVNYKIGNDIIKQSQKIFISDINREVCAIDGAKKYAEIIGKQASVNQFTREQSTFLLRSLCVSQDDLNAQTGPLYDLIDEVIALATIRIEQYLSGELLEGNAGSLF
jgi:hypothetical protein